MIVNILKWNFKYEQIDIDYKEDELEINQLIDEKIGIWKWYHYEII